MELKDLSAIVLVSLNAGALYLVIRTYIDIMRKK